MNILLPIVNTDLEQAGAVVGHSLVKLPDFDLVVDEYVEVILGYFGRNLHIYAGEDDLSSDLTIAITTKLDEIKRGSSAKLIQTPELNNRSLGEYDGQLYTDMRMVMPPRTYRVWERDPTHVSPGGESFEQLVQRVKQYLDGTKVAPLDVNIFIAYPDVLRAFVCLSTGMTLKEGIKFNVDPLTPVIA